ncbi:MAG: hypothetical protein Unbinned6354contig1000_12 [Prokaryotic dsDNA virus sp.]|nr:hypothetical protein [Cytophagaceae bacterium]QDP54309.1 MAG: hypothetical protein Unbinned6354contig1000_12 [Prokaryotic dsDNA virus sp.]|tara:strand:+ start:13663 stop:13953 length:291 start_codon:yes stop_codon:yes gene_type:complete
MGRRTVTKPTTDPVQFVMNHKGTHSYAATILNLTGANITVTVTNQDIQSTTSPTYAAPAAGALVISANTMGSINVPYEAMNLAGTGTGTIEIVEVG